MKKNKEDYDKTALVLAIAAAVMMFVCPIIGWELLSYSLKPLHYVGTIMLLGCPMIGFVLFVVAILRRAFKNEKH